MEQIVVGVDGSDNACGVPLNGHSTKLVGGEHGSELSTSRGRTLRADLGHDGH